MITAGIPDVNSIQTFVRDSEFEVRAPQAGPGLIVTPLHVKTNDGEVLLTWDGQTSEMDRLKNAEDILKGFVSTAEKALSRFPMSAQAHTNLGIALLKRGDVDRAISALQRSLELRPKDELTTLTLADGLFFRGEFEAAREIYSQFLGGRSYERAALGFAASSTRIGEFEKAANCLLSALLAIKESPALNFMLGMVELRRGQPNSAIRALRIATHIDVRNPTYHHSLGVAYAIQRNYQRAEEAFRTALTLSPASPDSVRGLGRVLANRGDKEGVIKLLAPFVETNPNDIEARHLLADAYIETRRYSLGRGHLKHLLQEHSGAIGPQNHMALLNTLALGFLGDGQTKEAELAFKRAIEISPMASSIPYENLGRLYLYQLDLPAEAKSVLTQSRRHFPDAQDTRVLLAISLAASEDLRSAIMELEPFWVGRSATEGTFVCLGWLYERIGDHLKAIDVLNTGLISFPASLHLLNNLAYTYLMSGHVERAAEIIAKVPKGAKLHVELVATMGLLKLWQGDEQAGRQFYEKAEAMAASEGRSKSAVNSVIQKKHLELARFFLRRREAQKAGVEIEHGLKLRGFPQSFKDDLEQLQRRLGQSSAAL